MAESSKPMKVLHITTVPLSLNFLTGQIRYMKAKGFEVEALASPGELLNRFGVREGVVVHAVDMPRRITPLRDLVAIFRLLQRLRRARPQIVHAHTPKGGLLGMISAWLAGVPIRIYHIHGLPFMTATGYKRLLLRWSEKVACLLAHQVLCVSHSIREVAITEKLCPTAKIKVLLGGSINGVDAGGKFCPDPLAPDHRASVFALQEIPVDAIVIGFIGRIVRDKGIVELVEVWKTLREEFPKLHLLMAGTFEPQDPIPVSVQYVLEHDPRVHLLGWLDDTSQLHAAIDVLVLPTYREGFPVVPLEAAAMMVPVVATRVPGCVDAVQDGITGTLVPPRDAEALAKAVRGYLLDPELRRKHGEAGRARVVRDFAQEAIWEAVYGEYIRLLQERNHPTPPLVKRNVEVSASSEVNPAL